MPTEPEPKRPTEAEIKILGVVWEHEQVTVRQVHDVLAQRQDIGLTTVLNLMQIMTEKGLLERDAAVRPQVFRAARPQRQTQRALLGDLVERAFAGSAGALALQALALRKSSPEELLEVRRLLDRIEAEGRLEEAGP